MAAAIMAAEPGTRARRVGEGLREELSKLLANDVKDPGAVGAVITRVEMTLDLRAARVYVRTLVAGDDSTRRRALMGAFRRASGMLRREATRRLALRYAPELRFVYDDGTDATTRIEVLLDEIAEQRRGR
jgi:ribosome-binding factor A